MNAVENKILQTLNNKQNFADVTVAELQNILNQYPYFSVAQLLLSKKMKEQNNADYLQQIQKTAVYLPNPFWLHYQLLQKDVFQTDVEKTSDNLVIEKNDLHEIAETEIQQSNSSITKENILNDEKNDDLLNENIQQQTQEKIALNKDVELSDLSKEIKIETEINSFKTSNTKLAELLQEHAAGFKKPMEKNEHLIVQTEPYYTVDYFASQGIKLDAQTQDKLESQVRRFTDWLKQMKRINPHPADLGTDPEMESRVQNSAASSNEPKEIVTEAMAEVLIKQGKIDKAVQVYTKLSFLNPDKSAYFASKIEELKRT
ncbi:MAG: hypothetical protein ACR2FN_11340 [Chitinophagaceae bacterium]